MSSNLGGPCTKCKLVSDFQLCFVLINLTETRYVPVTERRWSTTLTALTEVPCTRQALADADAVDGDVFLGLLQVVLAILVPNGTRIRLGIVVSGVEPVEFHTHFGGNVFWSRALVLQMPVCTITLLLALIAVVQGVPFVCVNPIGSYLLGRGGNITIGNYGCRAGRIGRRRIVLGPAIRAALLQKLDGNGDQEASRELIRTLDSQDNVRLREL